MSDPSLSFTDLLKNARYEELRQQVASILNDRWTWSAYHSLLEELGIRDPYGFLAAGWWLPAAVRVDPRKVDAFAEEAERAMAAKDIPTPEEGYDWQDVRRLMQRCGMRPVDAVDGLLWVYAHTQAEKQFLDALHQFAPDDPDAKPDGPDAKLEDPDLTPGNSDPKTEEPSPGDSDPGQEI